MFHVLQEFKFYIYLYKFKSLKESVNSEQECWCGNHGWQEVGRIAFKIIVPRRVFCAGEW